MKLKYKNLIFSGGGILGIAYLGALDYLYKTRLIFPIERVAGTSAGAITACLTSFNLSFEELSHSLLSLNYTQILDKDSPLETPRELTSALKEQFGKVFDNPKVVKYILKTSADRYTKFFQIQCIS